ncbi:MAG TPA: hypothetical protein VGG99_30185 [Acetobacteraceae bacterium]
MPKYPPAPPSVKGQLWCVLVSVTLIVSVLVPTPPDMSAVSKEKLR